MYPTYPDGPRRPEGGLETTYHVLADRHLGEAVAGRLGENGLPVHVTVAGEDRHDGGDATGLHAFRGTDRPDEVTAIVAAGSDERTLLAAQRLRSASQVDRVVALVTVPSRVEAFADAGHEPVCATELLSAGIADRL